MKVAVVEFQDYIQSVAEALDQVEAAATIAAQKKIILKPNVITDSPPPITTPVNMWAPRLPWPRAYWFTSAMPNTAAQRTARVQKQMSESAWLHVRSSGAGG